MPPPGPGFSGYSGGDSDMATLVCGSCGRHYTTNKPPTPGKTHRCAACGGLLGAAPEAPSVPSPAADSPPPSPVSPPAPAAPPVPSPAASQAVVPEGRTFGRYRILRVLGRGAMGVVYDALDGEGRRVALKTLLANPSELRRDEDRFLREIRLGVTLPPHPAMVRMLEAGVIEDKPYLAMEYIEGGSMAEWRKAHPGALREEVALLCEVARAVHHAHAHGIIHRDLKPQNVLVDAAGKPHVTDLGMAKTLGAEASLALTAAGMAVGSPTYMSPEQARGLKSVDGRTDVWSLGVMLYEALAGRPPFSAKTPIQVLHQVVRDSAPPPAAIARETGRPAPDASLAAIALRAIAKKPEDRFATAAEMADARAAWREGRAVVAAAVAPGPEAPAATSAPAPGGRMLRLWRRVAGWFRRPR